MKIDFKHTKSGNVIVTISHNKIIQKHKFNLDEFIGIEKLSNEQLKYIFSLLKTEKRLTQFRTQYKDACYGKRKLSRSDKKFLNDLRFELNTQSTYGEADPRFWVVMQTVKDFGIEDGYEDGVAMYDSEDTNCIYYELSECNDLIEDIIIDNWQDTNTIKSFDIHLENDIMTITTINNNDKEDVWELNSLEDVKNFLNDELLCYSDRYKIVGYRNREEIVANTFFLSIEECKRYIKLNAYHYNNPHPYAMTALGSYQMKKLIEILHNTDWNL